MKSFPTWCASVTSPGIVYKLLSYWLDLVYHNHKRIHQRTKTRTALTLYSPPFVLAASTNGAQAVCGSGTLARILSIWGLRTISHKPSEQLNSIAPGWSCCLKTSICTFGLSPRLRKIWLRCGCV